MKASANVFPVLLFGEGAAPVTPAASTVVAYAKADGLLYSMDDAGTETPLGGGGGGSGVVETIVAGTGITVDSTDPANPIVAASGAAPDWGDIGGTLSDQTDLQAALTAASPVGLHSVPIMAGAIQPSVTGGCSAVTSIASAANQPDIVTIDFDPTTQEYAQFSIPMPKSWNEGTLTAEFRWSHAATTTNFGVVFSIQAIAVSNDDTIAVNFGTAQQIADTGGTTNDLYVTSQTPSLTVGGTPAAGDTVFFRVSRVTGDGSDNMAVDARLHSVVLYMTTDASTDA